MICNSLTTDLVAYAPQAGTAQHRRLFLHVTTVVDIRETQLALRGLVKGCLRPWDPDLSCRLGLFAKEALAARCALVRRGGIVMQPRCVVVRIVGLANADILRLLLVLLPECWRLVADLVCVFGTRLGPGADSGR